MSLPVITKRLINVEEYHKMGDAGIITAEDRVELINGEIITMSPIGSIHTACVKRLNRLLFNLLSDKVIIGVQDPVVLNHYSEPEPDLSILKYQDDFYEEEHPTATAIYFLIEVSHSTLGYDRAYKLPLYAASGVKECWIVDVENRKVEVHRQPKEGAYSLVETFLVGETIKLSDFKGKIAVAKIFGKKVTMK